MSSYLILAALFAGVAIGWWRGYDHGEFKGYAAGYDHGYDHGHFHKRDAKGRFIKQ